MNIKYYFFATLTWFFSIMSLATLYTGYPDPVMVIVAAIHFMVAVGCALNAKASMLPKPNVTVVEVSPSDFAKSHHYDEWLDDGAPDDNYFAQRPEYQVPAQRRHLDDDE